MFTSRSGGRRSSIVKHDENMMSLQKCPFDAIMIINLPKNLERETMHRYGPNSFKLHRCLIMPTSQRLQMFEAVRCHRCTAVDRLWVAGRCPAVVDFPSQCKVLKRLRRHVSL